MFCVDNDSNVNRTRGKVSCLTGIFSGCLGSSSLSEGTLLGLGNPLLDVTAFVRVEFLTKYKLQPNNAVLASTADIAMFEDMIQNYDVDYMAGGSVQNTMRVAQWIIGKPNVTTLLGAIGDDKFGEILAERAKTEGVNIQLQMITGKTTGLCAVMVNGPNRSLCASPGASMFFSLDELKKKENFVNVENARFYYTSGFFLVSNPATVKMIAKFAASKKRPFIFNLSANYIVENHMQNLNEILPCVDILFGNAQEALALSKTLNFETTDVTDIAIKIANLPKENIARHRIVFITQGGDPIIVAEGGLTTTYTVPKVPIKETNGAGDAFCGGFLAKYIQGKPLKTCIQCGIWAASEVIQQVGCRFPKDKKFDDSHNL